MKIAIVTLPLHSNYGGILQAYALQTILERMGHKVTVIDRKRKLKPDVSITVRAKRFILKWILKQDIKPLYEIQKYKKDKVINKKTWEFIDKYINRRGIKSFDEIKQKDYDAFIVGSDQVWRYPYFVGSFKTRISSAFLYFAKNWNVRKISYAASFGTAKWEYPDEDTVICSECLSRFSAVSVREKEGLLLLSNYLNFKDGKVCLDPTLLLDEKDYLSLMNNCKSSHSKLFVYYLDYDVDKYDLVKKISGEKDLTPFEFYNRNVSKKSVVVSPSLQEWLQCLYNSDFIVTDSFHACVFSIIFKKPFIVFGNRERGISRYQSLLHLLGLEDRLIFKSSEYETNKIYSNILLASEKIKSIRNESYAFLEKALS